MYIYIILFNNKIKKIESFWKKNNLNEFIKTLNELKQDTVIIKHFIISILNDINKKSFNLKFFNELMPIVNDSLLKQTNKELCMYIYIFFF